MEIQVAFQPMLLDKKNGYNMIFRQGNVETILRTVPEKPSPYHLTWTQRYPVKFQVPRGGVGGQSRQLIPGKKRA